MLIVFVFLLYRCGFIFFYIGYLNDNPGKNYDKLRLNTPVYSLIRVDLFFFNGGV